jgi:hypothetical protein
MKTILMENAFHLNGPFRGLIEARPLGNTLHLPKIFGRRGHALIKKLKNHKTTFYYLATKVTSNNCAEVKCKRIYIHAFSTYSTTSYRLKLGSSYFGGISATIGIPFHYPMMRF